MNQFQESRSVESDSGMEQKIKLNLNNAVQLQKHISDEIDKLQKYISTSKVNQPPKENGSTVIKAKNEMAKSFEKVYCVLESLANDLTELIDNWKSRFQLHYAKLMAEPDLEEIAKWCAQTGEIIHELLYVSIKKWRDIWKNFNLDDTLDVKLETDFCHLLTSLFQRTFVVSKQENIWVKTETVKFKTFCVRVLAADYWYKQSAEVTAHFVPECELKKCFHGDDLDLKALKEKEIKLNVYKKQKSTKPELKIEKGKDKMQYCFQNLKFEKQFKRQQTNGSKPVPVHEEKFRIVFITEMESKTCWTMSLPLVVISASSQEVNSLASIMWQCCSTNVFSLQEDTPEKLEWSVLSTMLQRKMRMLPESKSLTKANIVHLKNRLFGVENQRDDALVSLTQFCFNDMPGVKFSFWKWFLGVFNLIEQHLLQYWNEGLIMGFLKKEDAENMLLKCNKVGTFILRFSDTQLINRDGLDKVCGYITSSLLCMKKRKTEVTGDKRNSTSQPEAGWEKVVGHDILHQTDCPPGNLANKLKNETNYKYIYLYPGNKTRKILFDKYCKDDEENHLPGYKKTTDLTDLEEEVTQMSISKEVKTSTSTEDDANSQLGPTAVKKPRCNTNEKWIESDKKSTDNQRNVSSHIPVQSGRSFNNQSPGSLSLSPGFLDQSPVQSVPNTDFQRDLRDELNQDSVVPNIPNSSRLPTFPTDLFGIDFVFQNTLNKEEPCENQDWRTLSDKDTYDLDTTYAGAGICMSPVENSVIIGEDSITVAGTDRSEEGVSVSVNDVNSKVGGAISSFNGMNTKGLTHISQNLNGLSNGQGDPYNEMKHPDTRQFVLNEVSKWLKPNHFKTFLSWIETDKDDAAIEKDPLNTLPNTEHDMELDSGPNDPDEVSLDDLFDIDLTLLKEIINEENVPDITDLEADNQHE